LLLFSIGSSNGKYGCQHGVQNYDSSLPNSNYYQRMCRTNRNLIVMTGGIASDEAVERVAFLIDHVTEFVDQAAIDKMNENGFRHAVMAEYPKELTLDIPEHAWLVNTDSGDPNGWNERARGLGAEVGIFLVGSSAEENALCYPDDRYKGYDLTIHEFAHSLANLGLKYAFSSFEPKLKQLYQNAKSNLRNLYDNGNFYGMTNHKEYFAEGVGSYFDANFSPERTRAPTTRALLQQKDPDLYNFIDYYLGKNQWRFSCQEGQLQSSCQLHEGQYLVKGNGIGNHWTSSNKECFDLCQDDTKCQAWTRDLKGGQCYLKSSLTSTGQAPNWIWGTKCEGQGWKGCKATKGQYLVSGNIITSKWTGNNEDCSDWCGQTIKCKGWMRDGSGRCYLKTAIGLTGDHPDWSWGAKC